MNCVPVLCNLLDVILYTNYKELLIIHHTYTGVAIKVKHEALATFALVAEVGLDTFVVTPAVIDATFVYLWKHSEQITSENLLEREFWLQVFAIQ